MAAAFRHLLLAAKPFRRLGPDEVERRVPCALRRHQSQLAGVPAAPRPPPAGPPPAGPPPQAPGAAPPGAVPASRPAVSPAPSPAAPGLPAAPEAARLRAPAVPAPAPAQAEAAPAAAAGAAAPRAAARGRAAKAARDPARPKKPATAWLRYLQHFRSRGSQLKQGEMMKAAAAEWKTMSDEQKRPFVEQYEAEKARYDEAFKEYADSGQLSAWKRDPEKPTRPHTGYMHFLAEFRLRSSESGEGVLRLAKRAGEAWKGMSAAEKAPYEQKAVPEMEKYKEAMKAYKESGKENAWKAKVGLSKNQPANARGDAGKGEKP